MSTIEEALARARIDRPYFARGLFALHPVPVEGLGTLGVDKHWRLYYDPAFLAKCSHAEGATVVLHELEHVRRRHHPRSLQIPSVDVAKWNIAGDAEINDDLKAEKCPFPVEEVQPKTIGCKDGLLAEDYYANMKPPKAPQGACEGGSGAGVPQPWEKGSPGQGEALPGVSQAEERALVRGIAEDIKAAAGRAPGSVPAELLRWAEMEVSPPTLPWQQILAAEVRRGIAVAAGRVDYSYARLSRRQGNREIRIPASVRPVPNVALVIDTSGSMGDSEGKKALGEAAGVCLSVGAGVHVISCDTSPHVQKVTTSRQIKALGGGGTDMGAGIREAEKRKADLIVVLTDGDTPWPEKAPKARTIVCLVRETSTPTPTWARVVNAA